MMKKTEQIRVAFTTKLNTWIEATLAGTHDHYSCYLPKLSGFFAPLLLRLIFFPIKVNGDQTAKLQEIPKDGIVVYVSKYKSYFEYLFYHTRYSQKGLPFPEISLDYKHFLFQPLSRIFKILLAHLDCLARNFCFPDPYGRGYISNELAKGRVGFLSLIEKKGFYRRFVKSRIDPVRYLIAMQQSSSRPIIIIPQLMFFNRNPVRSHPSVIDVLFGTKEKPGRIRRLITLCRSPGRVFVEVSEPVNLLHFLERTEVREYNQERQSFALRNYLLAQINRHRQTITGPVLKTRDELKENILTSERFHNFLEYYSRQRKIPLLELHRKADAYLEEIAANYNTFAAKIAEVTVRWISKALFDQVVVDDDEISHLKTMSLKGPLILIPCHKSHLDYIILPYVLYTHNLPCPHAVAGKNLFFWPIGTFLRWLGAFSIRRTLSGAVLYTKVFAEYIQKLLEEGYNIELFIEGGRSRTGKLGMPQLGFLSILLNAFKNGVCDDMLFVPIYIGYDRVIEESSYLHEIEGGQKQPENLSQFLKAGKLLKKKYGKIYLKFHKPFSLKTYMLESGLEFSQMTSKDQNRLCRNLGHKIANAIDKLSIVTPHALVASAILNCSKKRFTFEYLMSLMETYRAYLTARQAALADTLLNPGHGVWNAFNDYIQRKFIEPITSDKHGPNSKTLFKINKQTGLAFYKNNCIAFFVPAAFTALAILERDTFLFDAAELQTTYKFLAEFFENEFTIDLDKTPEDAIKECIKAFLNDGIVIADTASQDKFQLTSTGFKKLPLFAGFLTTFFESYWIVLHFFMHNEKHAGAARDRLRKIQSVGNRLYKRKEIARKEALSKITFGNAEKFFNAHGVKGSEDKEKITYYADAIQSYLNILSP